MAKTRVFISFDYDNDARQKDLLVGQSKHPDTDFEFADWSSKEHLTGDWKAKIKAKLAYVDVVCCCAVKICQVRPALRMRSRLLRRSASLIFCWLHIKMTA